MKTLFTLMFLFAGAMFIISCEPESVEPEIERTALVSETADLESQVGNQRTKWDGKYQCSRMSIQVLSPNWSTSGVTCPGETLEITVFGGCGPFFWNIQGATLINATSDRRTIFVRTSSAPSTNLYFEATSIYQQRASISGVADENQCRFLCDLYPELSICDQGGPRDNDNHPDQW